jgi:tetratricopeptide (TPR) repeat protein
VHHHRGEWQKAAEYYEKSYALHEALGDALGCAGILNSLGLARKEMGDLDGAEETYQRGIQILRERDDLLRVTVLMHNLAIVHEEKGEYRKALSLLEEVISLDKRMGNPDLKRDMLTFRRIRRQMSMERDVQVERRELGER